jgi:hypothetical protein
MAALAVSTTERTAVPLIVARVEDPGRLCRIYSQVHGWYVSANKTENGDSSDDFDVSSVFPKEEASKYYDIAQKIAEVVGCRINFYGPDQFKAFEKHQILAAYDRFGNLQGVAVVKFTNKKDKLVAKIEYLVTAIWNMPFPNPKRDWRVKGAGTCLLSKITKTPKLAAIFVEPTKEAEGFYLARSFAKVPNWTPKTLGASCGMMLYQKDFQKIQELAVNQLISTDRLPYTLLHFRSQIVTPMLDDLKESTSNDDS